MKPQLWVIAGPNGAGKSTLADRYLAGRIPLINPDNIARERLLRNLESVAEHRDERSQKRLSLEEIGRREMEKQQREIEKQRSLEAEREQELSEKQKDRDWGLER